MNYSQGFGPFTGWTSGRSVYLKAGGSMVCMTSRRKTTTEIPVRLTLVCLERIEEPTPVELPREVWLVSGADGGLYCTTHEHLRDQDPV